MPDTARTMTISSFDSYKLGFLTFINKQVSCSANRINKLVIDRVFLFCSKCIIYIFFQSTKNILISQGPLQFFISEITLDMTICMWLADIKIDGQSVSTISSSFVIGFGSVLMFRFDLYLQSSTESCLVRYVQRYVAKSYSNNEIVLYIFDLFLGSISDLLGHKCCVQASNWFQWTWFTL